jgi:hypothetical protein
MRMRAPPPSSWANAKAKWVRHADALGEPSTWPDPPPPAPPPVHGSLEWVQQQMERAASGHDFKLVVSELEWREKARAIKSDAAHDRSIFEPYVAMTAAHERESCRASGHATEGGEAEAPDSAPPPSAQSDAHAAVSAPVPRGGGHGATTQSTRHVFDTFGPMPRRSHAAPPGKRQGYEPTSRCWNCGSTFIMGAKSEASTGPSDERNAAAHEMPSHVLSEIAEVGKALHASGMPPQSTA